MSKTAFVFPGQGAQCFGMGKDFYEQIPASRNIFEEAGRLLGLDMCALCFEENDKLNLTEYTQAALVTTELAILAAVSEGGFTADTAAGLSLGEYAALAASGVLSPQDAITAVRQRGIFMEEAVPHGIGSMCAVLGLTAEDIEECLSGIEGAAIANYNCPGQIVITGYREAVEQAAALLKEKGAKRVVPLNVSGPFHSWLLEQAGQRLAKVLETVSFHDPVFPYVTNVTGGYVTKAEEVPSLLVRQVSSPVRWQQSIEAMLTDGIDTFVEIGPGRTLSSFIRKISKEAKILRIGTVEDLNKEKAGI